MSGLRDTETAMFVVEKVESALGRRGERGARDALRSVKAMVTRRRKSSLQWLYQEVMSMNDNMRIDLAEAMLADTVDVVIHVEDEGK